MISNNHNMGLNLKYCLSQNICISSSMENESVSVYIHLCREQQVFTQWTAIPPHHRTTSSMLRTMGSLWAHFESPMGHLTYFSSLIKDQR